MHPERASRLLSILGVYLLVAALILRMISLVVTTWQVRMGLDNISVQPTLPKFGQYQVSPDGKQIIFAQQIDASGSLGWFSMPLVGGAISLAQPPGTDLDPFRVVADQVYYLSGEKVSKVDALPSNSHIVGYSRSPDKKALAFAASWASKNVGLFIISLDGKLAWLGDHERITEIGWAPDGQNLAFIAPVNRFDQVFLIRRDGQVEHQLTNDPANKSNPRWSPDGKTIAFVAARSEDHPFPNDYSVEPMPQAPLMWSIHLVGINGENAHQFNEDEQTRLNLAWGVDGSDPVLLYSLRGPTQAKSLDLYALNPRTGQVRRAYPPQEITAFNCPATLQANQPGTVQVAIKNTGSSEVGVNLAMRARSGAFTAVSPWNTGVVQSEIVQVPPGSTQTFTRPVKAQPGLFTHLSIGINPYGIFAMNERRCVIKNTYFGLPNLSFLPVVLLLSLVGLVLCVPWLRLQKKARLWALYLAIPVLTLVVLFLEVRLVGM